MTNSFKQEKVLITHFITYSFSVEPEIKKKYFSFLTLSNELSLKIEESEGLMVVWIYELDFWIAQGMWLGPWSKAPLGQLEFIEN